jgi:hypothetical protein
MKSCPSAYTYLVVKLTIYFSCLSPRHVLGHNVPNITRHPLCNWYTMPNTKAVRPPLSLINVHNRLPVLPMTLYLCESTYPSSRPQPSDRCERTKNAESAGDADVALLAVRRRHPKSPHPRYRYRSGTSRRAPCEVLVECRGVI